MSKNDRMARPNFPNSTMHMIVFQQFSGASRASSQNAPVGGAFGHLVVSRFMKWVHRADRRAVGRSLSLPPDAIEGAIVFAIEQPTFTCSGCLHADNLQ
jgi:hypothetical protein